MNPKDRISVSDCAITGLAASNELSDEIVVAGSFKVVCKDSEGVLRWEEDLSNLVVTVGKNDLLDKYFLGSSYSAVHYVGLKVAGSINAADTMSSKSWTEITNYSNATRPAFTAASASGGSTSNVASPAVFNINGAATVGGCFITTNNTKGGTTGVLFSATDFAVARDVLSDDTLTVTYTISC